MTGYDPDDEIDQNDFNVDLTGLTVPSRIMAWVKKPEDSSTWLLEGQQP